MGIESAGGQRKWRKEAIDWRDEMRHLYTIWYRVLSGQLTCASFFSSDGTWWRAWWRPGTGAGAGDGARFGLGSVNDHDHDHSSDEHDLQCSPHYRISQITHITLRKNCHFSISSNLWTVLHFFCPVFLGPQRLTRPCVQPHIENISRNNVFSGLMTMSQAFGGCALWTTNRFGCGRLGWHEVMVGCDRTGTLNRTISLVGDVMARQLLRLYPGNSIRCQRDRTYDLNFYAASQWF